MMPNTILLILTLKLYFGHTHLQGQTNQAIEASLEHLQVECGCNIALEKILEDENTGTKDG